MAEGNPTHGLLSLAGLLEEKQHALRTSKPAESWRADLWFMLSPG